ncbi:hypothetical protein [Vibrio tapetis]|uniref:Uncharacterized protein n=1 Tax=Vibrio tapetis subsp. tapetis TaxID=1671868 RepID=A0A2N8ZAM7_9VIBR|nr:hypothetical protein [Vibrio tapetis]SON48927.1 protein of unknown function [Vibrio tapetis subsp. tapetis]
MWLWLQQTFWMRLSTGQRERLWARFDHDPEPDLQTQLIRILIATSSKRVEALVFDNSLALKPNRLTRKILKSSHNKVLLYQVLKSSALDLHEIALTRLADLNAKEYLQDFLSLISSSNVQLQGIAAATLVRWQYPVSATYIIPLFTASGTCASISGLQSLSAIVKPDTLDWLVKQWQQGSLNHAHIGTLFHCAVRFSYDLNSLLPQYYQTFIELNATQKIDTLAVLTKRREITISAAFIRQTIESKQCDNAVKLLLIPYLWQQSTDEHIAYAKQLMFTSTPKLIQHSNKLVDSGKTTALPITAPQTATPMSTLMSLSAPLMESPASSSITNKKQPAKRARKVARIDPLSNQELAVRYCNEASLVKAFLHQYLSEDCTTPSTLIEIGRACVNAGIAYQTVKTDELHQQIIGLILSPENATSPYLIQWLGWRELQLNLDHIAINSNRLTLVKIAEISHDIPLLTSWLTHQYIGVKKAAAKRLLQISEPLSTPYRTTITAALDDPELTSLLRNSHLKEVTKVLIPLFTHNPKKALLSLSYINGDSAS